MAVGPSRWDALVDVSHLLGILIIQMKFEFDPAKSAINGGKHGIDFVRAQRLWEDSDRLQIPARTEGEPRYMVIGKIEEEHWSAIVTFRGENIRIISVRRSRADEVHAYEN